MIRSKVEALLNRMRNDVDDKHFNMSKWLSSVDTKESVQYISEDSIPFCQTAGCLAGEVFLGLTPKERLDYRNKLNLTGGYLVQIAATRELGLNSVEANRLFEPYCGDMSKITREDAIEVLEHILSHSEIDWYRVIGERLHMAKRLPLKVELA